MTTPADDDSGIRAAINLYVEGIRTGDVASLRQGFHAQANMCGYLGDTAMATPIQGLYDWVQANPAPSKSGELFRCSISSIEITGRVASVKVIEEWPNGKFVDYFSLLKVEDRWWIVSKTFDAA